MKPVYAKSEPIEDGDGLNPIKVNFKGVQPTIKDFVSALLAASDEDEAMNGLKESWGFYKNGMKQMPGEDLIVDTQNGYVGYSSELSDNERLVIECCYWNYADKRHKLLAVTNGLTMNGKPVAGQFTGITFYKYDNAIRQMHVVYGDAIGLVLDTPDDIEVVTHTLPRQGKTMVFTYYTSSGKKIEKRLTWNGSKFVQQ
jgi:hypothetical protein